MQRECGQNAEWKKIQQNTFTRWTNERLKLVNRHIENLETDLSDGLNLIALIEILVNKKLPRYNHRPQFRSQKLENVSVVLDYLENIEKRRLVNIDASDIVDGKLKLILGLLWTLILHYSISLPAWEIPNEKRDTIINVKPKQKLMNWLQAKLSAQINIANFTSDWNDGRAIGAVLNSCYPGMFDDFFFLNGK
jgi:filamin